MDRLQFITHKSKKIFLEDFTNLKPGPEFLALLDQARQLIASQPPKSVLALFDASGSNFNNEILTAMKEFTKANTPYIKVAVVVGITGLLQVALAAVSKFAGRDFITFKTRDEALEYLAGRAD